MSGIGAAQSGLLTDALAWTFFQSLWQGVVVVGCAAIGRRIASCSSVKVRVGAIACALFVIAQAVTFWIALHREEPQFVASEQDVARILSDRRDDQTIEAVALPQALDDLGTEVAVVPSPWITWAWAILLTALLARVGISVFFLRRLMRLSMPLEKDLVDRYRELARALGITRSVCFAETLHARVPLVAGIREPLVLLPIRERLKLSERQIDAIILHELAHVRRRDVLASVIRSVVGTLYFFHPAIVVVRRWIERDVEIATDDLAARILGDRPAYAAALVQLIEQRQSTPLALNAGGGSLRDRIVSVLREPQESRRRNRASLFGTSAAAVILLLLLGAVLTSYMRDRADLAFIERHDLAKIVVATLSTDRESPEFLDAFADSIREIEQTGATTAATRVRLQEQALAGLPSDFLYRNADPAARREARPTFGRYGSFADHRKLVAALLANARTSRETRATLVIAGVCGIGDANIAFRKAMWSVNFVRQAGLSPSDFYRLQLACSLYGERLARIGRRLDRIRHDSATPEDAELALHDLCYLPDTELALSDGRTAEQLPALIDAVKRINAGNALPLLCRAYGGN